MAEKQEILVANLTLDTYQKNNIPPLVIPQGDYGARVIRVRITEQGRPVTVTTSEAASIVAERIGDGESKAFSGTVNEDGTLDVPVTQWMLDLPDDDVICHVVITGNDYQYSTTEFLIEPKKKANPTEIAKDDPRQDIVTEILANESARQAAEATRRANETGRESAEDARKEAEAKRLQDEELRTANEALRATAEFEREAAEDQRAEAEAERAIAESGRKKEIEILDQRITKTEKRLTNIEQGVMADCYETDDSVAYVKDVPTNALPYAAISKVGGMTRKSANLYDGTFTNAFYTTDGTLTSNNGARLSDFIYINGKAITFYCKILADGDALRFAAFDKDKNFIERIDISRVSYGHYENANAVYVRVGIFADKYDADTMMVYFGRDEIPYEPYFEGLRSASVTEVESVGVNLFDKSKVQNATETDTGFSFTWTGTESAPNQIGTLKNLAPQLKVGDYVTFYANVTNASIDHGNGFLYLSGSKTNWWGGDFITITQADLDGILYTYGKKDMLCEYADLRITKIENAPYTPYREPVSLHIPAEVRPAHGINDDVYDYLDFGEQESVKRVGSVVFDGSADENWEVTQYTNLCACLANENFGKIPNNVLCDRFDTFANMSPQPNGTVGIAVEGFNTKANTFFFGVSGIATNVAEWRAYLAANPVMVFYELAEPIITDISDILSADNLIGVEGGGTITMVNEHEYAVPSEIIYQVKGVSV